MISYPDTIKYRDLNDAIARLQGQVNGLKDRNIADFAGISADKIAGVCITGTSVSVKRKASGFLANIPRLNQNGDLYVPVSKSIGDFTNNNYIDGAGADGWLRFYIGNTCRAWIESDGWHSGAPAEVSISTSHNTLSRADGHGADIVTDNLIQLRPTYESGTFTVRLYLFINAGPELILDKDVTYHMASDGTLTFISETIRTNITNVGSRGTFSFVVNSYGNLILTWAGADNSICPCTLQDSVLSGSMIKKSASRMRVSFDYDLSYWTICFDDIAVAWIDPLHLSNVWLSSAPTGTRRAATSARIEFGSSSISFYYNGSIIGYINSTGLVSGSI